MFSDCRQETTDLPLLGQAPKVVTEKLITYIDTAIKENRGRNIRDIETKFSVSISTVQNIVHEEPTLFFAD